MTYEESDYIITECNQEANVEEMSIWWVTQELRIDETNRQV